MIAEKFPEIAALPLSEKRLLIHELCEDVIGLSETADPSVIRILEERWKRHNEDPSGAVTLEEFRERTGMG